MDFNNLKYFMNHLSKELNPGNAVEVYIGGNLVFRYASGYSDLENKVSMSGDEMFHIYSCTKVATAVATLQLLERGQILLTDPLYDYIPEYKEMYVRSADGSIKKAENHITVGNLLSMTAGFSYDKNMQAFQIAREKTNGRMDTLETIRCLAMEPLCFEPGTRWQYGFSHDVLGALISVVSGKKFRDYMQENIFNPLDMKDTCFHVTEDTKGKMAEQYAYVSDGKGINDIVKAQQYGTSYTEGFIQNVGKEAKLALGNEFDSGGGGIITTVSDYAKFTAALACWGRGINGEKILSKHSVDLMRKNRLNHIQLKDFNWKQLRGCGYGLGVRTHIDQAKSGLICNLGEFGWGGAAGSSVIVDPDINLGVFFAQHTLNPREEYYQPRLRNVVYSCLKG